MERLLIFFAILQFVHNSSCPKGYELVNEVECRGFQAKVSSLNFENATAIAIERCDEVQGQTVFIHNEEDQSFWKGMAPSETYGYLVLGLVCNSITNKWNWADGSAVDYKPAKYNKALDESCSPGFGWILQPNGLWTVEGAGVYLTAYIFCTTKLQDGPYVNDDCVDGICYEDSAAVSWEDAQPYCQKLGGNVASIHNAKANTFIRRLAISYGAVDVNGVLLGASMSSADAPFLWSDGTEMDYKNYYPGFPKDFFGGCTTMDTTTTAGLWYNVDCAAHLPVVCARKGVMNWPETWETEAVAASVH